MLPSNIAASLAATDAPRVLVGTIQTLARIAREALKTYATLARHVALVIVDEGHREPAPE